MSDEQSKAGLLHRIAKPIARLVKGGGAVEAAPRKERAGSAGRGGQPFSQALTDEDFRLAVDQLVQEQDGRFGVKLQVVSLVEFREAVGERWSKVADKVMMIAEGVINLHLGAGNMFTRQGNDMFVLLFRNTPPDEARRRTLAIAQELGTRLVGDQFEGVEQPLALAAELDAAEAFQPGGVLNLGKVHAAVSAVRSVIVRDVADTASRAWVPRAAAPAAAEAPRRHMMPSAPAPAARPAPPASLTGLIDGRASGPEPQWKPLDPRRDQRERDWNAVAVDPSVPLPAAGTEDLPPESKLTMLWRPTWVAAGEAIGAYIARVVRHDFPEAAPLEGSGAYARLDAPSCQTIDRFGVAGAVRDFRVSDNAGNGSTVVIPIHWATLSAANRMEFLAPFADIAPAARGARVIIDLFGVPEGVGDKALAEAVRAAKPLCREVALRVRLASVNTRLASDCGASLIGVDMSELTEAEKTDDQHLIASLARLLATARRAGLGAYVWNIRRRPALYGAIHAGFAMVNGPALMKDIARPAKQLPAPKSRFVVAPPQ
ncbi:hypothetical protein [Magnetospirillum sp. UT-4]|uniref:hypothetical protein n=1 Tax=Magnetospirillum sp. UT-4 TaxID=2681467 RepID=UPI0013827F24|nr:hypothetical protein [Magnetospirillum sp. UT-4]CAA7626957.1 conserved hypothetical protein [Magnetospirillum sp. UT-4]